MQTIKVTFPVPGVNGSHDITRTFQVDESIGLKAGRDIYATARGTAISFAKKFNPFAWIWVNLVIDDTVFYHMYWDSTSKTWIKDNKQ